eukprot:Phypoly_transcript_07518.p1 GENE.Phypoly_transcript_07518~~Phypoly_transcript_07518.p1  ORF type:complete len:391 (+),score=37.76 Phypoly_transcript_07518:326-1498(+)
MAKSPYSVLHKPWVLDTDSDSYHCQIITFIEVSTLAGAAACTTLICITLVLLIVVRVRTQDMETKPIYYWSFLGFTLLYPFGAASISLALKTHWTEHGKCVINSTLANTLVRGPYIAFLIIQIILLAIITQYTLRISRSVQGNVSQGIPVMYVFVRFIATFIAQAYNVLPSQLNLIFQNPLAKFALAERILYASHATGPILDALVMIFGNREFTAYVCETCHELVLKMRPWFGTCKSRTAARLKKWKMWRARCTKPRRLSEAPEIELSPSGLRIELSVENIKRSMEIEIPPENSTTEFENSSVHIEISPDTLDQNDEIRFSTRTPSTSSLTSMDLNGIHFYTFIEEVNYLSEPAGNPNAKLARNSNSKSTEKSNAKPAENINPKPQQPAP